MDIASVLFSALLISFFNKSRFAGSKIRSATLLSKSSISDCFNSDNERFDSFLDIYCTSFIKETTVFIKFKIEKCLPPRLKNIQFKFIVKSSYGYTGTADLNLIIKHLLKHFVMNTKSSNLFSLFSNVFLAILTKLL